MRLLLLVLLTGCLAAADPAPLLARLQEAQRGVATLRTTFTQEKRLALFDEPVTSQGVLEISRPETAVRWEYTGRSTLVLRQGRLRRWGADGREEPFGDDPGLAALQAQMESLLSGDWSTLGELFTVGAATDAPALALTPKAASLGKYVARIDIVFRDDLLAPASVRIASADGDETLYTFAAPETGVALAAARFTGP